MAAHPNGVGVGKGTTEHDPIERALATALEGAAARRVSGGSWGRSGTSSAAAV